MAIEVSFWRMLLINLIGGINSGEENIVANNGGNGVEILTDTSKNNTILRNSIYNNGGIGIDLSNGLNSDGVTLNDANDTDEGVNDLLNFPELVGAAIVSGDLYYDFDLDVPIGDYRIEFLIILQQTLQVMAKGKFS